ncbi:SdrD B-like domain-containing protein [Alteromonadaceae bacterium BrNp21-10]|nr:SdrD B-like domain-containing protein [Alteromonadaceae bacterium BrNp21-10]
MRNLLRLIITILFWVSASAMSAEVLQQVELNTDEIILLDVVLNNETVAQSVDAYLVEEQLMIAIEPLLDALKVRYSLSEQQLLIWNGSVGNEFTLSKQTNVIASNEVHYRWATDDFYVFVDVDLFQSLFPSQMEFLQRRLQLSLKTPEKSTLFPLQKLRIQEKQRLLSQSNTGRKQSNNLRIPITIADQYRLATVPHGRVNIAAVTGSRDKGVNASVQLVSDLLYHSADLTITDNNNNDLAARLTLGRYKTAPDEYILGVYDRYQIGDITSTTNSVNTASSAGIGFTFNRRPQNFRRDNQSIILEETAPPGWEAELFRNQIFLTATTVPDNGLLIFDDVEVYYGSNTYSIKLYGPYGEEETITKQLVLKENALGEGEFATSFYGLDRNHRLINDQSSLDYGITDFGGTFDYGINDNWQIGVGISALVDNNNFYNLKNAFSFPGMLLENDLSVDENGNYAQITSLIGSVFGRDNYSIAIETADDYVSDRIKVDGESKRISGSYGTNYAGVNIILGAEYQKDDNFQQKRVTNRLSGNIGNIRLTHNLSYFQNELFEASGIIQSDGIIGSLGVSGNLPFDIRVSGQLDYDPEENNPIVKTSSIRFQKRYQDPWKGYHYFNLNYLPLAEEVGSSWQLGYRAAWLAEQFQLNVATTYDEEDNWNFQLGLQFFLGYDHRNNRFLFNQKMHSNSASLDIHTYLDRQINGEPDPLDYNLENVTFSGNPEWKKLSSGANGRTILPGVFADTPFKFAAKWKEGSASINNDYVVYTHPGAYVDVNMPFILSTDLAGFVFRSRNEQEMGLQNAEVELVDIDGEIIQTIETDSDGYYEFLGLAPGTFQLRVSPATLMDKGYTSDVVGLNIATGGNGGYVELPSFILQRVADNGERAEEQIISYALDADNSEAMVWDDDRKKRRNYFTLPTKNKVTAQRSLSQSNKLESIAEEDNQIESNRPQGLATNDQKLTLLPQFSYMANDRKNPGQLPSIRVGVVSPVASVTNPISDNDTSDVVQVGQVAVVQDFINQQGSNNPPSNNVLTQSDGAEQMMSGEFVIQLGSYSDIIYAQEVLDRLSNNNMLRQNFEIVSNASNNNFKLVYGHFNSRAAGVEFANSYLPSTQSYFVKQIQAAETVDPIDTQAFSAGWIIQFYASTESMVKGEFTDPYASIGELFFGQKQVAGQDVLYCLISTGFTTREEAEAALIKSGLSGWVNRSSNYSNIMPVQ